MERTVKPYSEFAQIYDLIMAGVDYEAWADYVVELFKRFNFRPGRLLDLACGTGSSTLPFARRGYDVAAVDISAEMLKQASKKAEEEGLAITFQQVDLTDLTVEYPFDAALLFQDGLNYITREDDLRAAFAAVKEALNPGGLFIFDLCRPGQRSEGKGATFCVDEEEFTLTGETGYCAENGLWEVRLIVFARQEAGDYKKYIEVHRERDYSPGTVSCLLEETGFLVRGCYPSFKLEAASGREAKLTFVAENRPEGLA